MEWTCSWAGIEENACRILSVENGQLVYWGDGRNPFSSSITVANFQYLETYPKLYLIHFVILVRK
jgi:hypothetical protein